MIYGSSHSSGASGAWLMIYGSRFMVHGSWTSQAAEPSAWLMVEADGKQAEAHYPENSSRDVERDERGSGKKYKHCYGKNL